MGKAIAALETGGTVYQTTKKKIDELVADQNEVFSYNKVVIPLVVGADASAGINFTMPFAMKITEVKAYCTTAVTSATAKLRRSTTDMSGAAVMAVANTTTATTVVDAQRTVAAGEVLNVITASNADRGIVYVEGYRL